MDMHERACFARRDARGCQAKRYSRLCAPASVHASVRAGSSEDYLGLGSDKHHALHVRNIMLEHSRSSDCMSKPPRRLALGLLEQLLEQSVLELRVVCSSVV
eukprot:6191054-Pleurochrysis_carterae.AAC.1